MVYFIVFINSVSLQQNIDWIKLSQLLYIAFELQTLRSSIESKMAETSEGFSTSRTPLVVMLVLSQVNRFIASFYKQLLTCLFTGEQIFCSIDTCTCF